MYACVQIYKHVYIYVHVYTYRERNNVCMYVGMYCHYDVAVDGNHYACAVPNIIIGNRLFSLTDNAHFAK